MKTLKHWLAILILCWGYSGFAGIISKTISDTKTWNKTFEVNTNAQFNLLTRESDITIATWDQNRVEVTITLTVEAFEQEEIDKLFAALAPSMEGSSNEVSITNPACVQQIISTPKRMRLKINNEIIKVKDYHFSYNIKMPATNHINLKNRFGNVSFGSHQGKVDIELYECDFRGSGINSLATAASLKFSDGNLGASRDMKLSTYESDIALNRAERLNLNAKFSEIKFLSVRDAEINAYESDLNLGITNSVVAKQNFGTLIIAEAKTLSLTSYELTFESVSIDKLTMPSTKFSKITCGTVGELNIGAAYENRMTFGEVVSLEMEAKFSHMDIGKLEKFAIVKGYELNLYVGHVSNTFSMVDLNAKFSNASFSFEGSPGYSLKANLSYGNLEFPNENLEDLKVDKKGNSVNVSGKTKGYTGTSVISLSGYETDVSINYN